MKLEAGQKLGPYEILSTLGVGGMGEVYRARDTRLERDVAIKVLPRSLASNTDALTRFEREAKAVAALSHPNIMAIHDFGEHDGIVYAAIELLEGETLRETLEPGPLPVRKATDYARQAARGLGAAHDSGIVHRDLKPENIFVSRDGRIKILDFGLARTASEEPEELPENSATRTHLTTMGTVLGTINYMSPEQARGETAGPASDIFSLGSVLFEMLHGRRPFERETAPETLTAILREDPPEISLSDSGASFSVQRIIQRCLEKRPEERFQSAHDLAFALETSSGTTSGVAPVSGAGAKAGKSRRLSWLPMLLLLTLGLVVGAFFGKQFSNPPVAQSVKTTPITFSGFDANPAASPDGRTIVFSSRRSAATGIWLKQLKGGSEVPLTRGEDVLPRFSPDGSTVLFIRNEAEQFSIYRVPLVGGQPRKLIDNAGEADWSPDGSQVVFFRGVSGDSSIWTANADGSGQKKLVDLTNEVPSSPRWSPDGRTIAFVSAPSNNNISLTVFLMDVESGEIRELPPKRPSISGLAWSGAGEHLVFAWSKDLLSGLASSSVQVSMQNVTDGETTDLFWARNLLRAQLGTRIDIAGDGRLVYSMVHTAQNLREITLNENGPGRVRTVTSGSSADRQPKYAPDGETVIFSSNRNGNLDIWTIHTGTGVVQQLTDDEARDWDPTWSADGSKIVWSSDRGGNLEIWIADADGSGARQVSHDGVDAENPSITPDGEWIVYMTSNPGKSGMWKVRVNGEDTTQLWSGSGFIPEMSPDGKHVAFATTSGSNLTTIMVLDMETAETSTFSQMPRSSNFTSGAEGRSRWTSDGKSIAYIALQDEQTGVMIQDFIPGRDTSATQRKFAGFDVEWITESFAISPDGKRVMLARIRPGGTVMMAENVPLITRP